MRYLFTLCFLTIFFGSVSAQLLFRVDSMTIYSHDPWNPDYEYQKFHYSHGRGSDAFHQVYYADSLHRKAIKDHKPKYRSYSIYSATDSLTIRKTEKYNDTFQRYEFLDSVALTYDSQNNLIEQFRMASHFQVGPERTRMEYDANGNMVHRYEEYLYMGNWLLNIGDSFYYNNANQLMRTYNYSHGHQDTDSLIYDANGRLIARRGYTLKWGVGLYLAREILYQYDNTGNLSFRTVYYINHTTGNLELMDRDSFGYDMAGRVVARTHQYWDTNFNAFKNTGRDEYTYNSLGVLSKFTMRSPITSATLGYEEQYFYEAYFPAGIAASAQKLVADVQMYPVPTSGVLNVNVQFKRSQTSTLTVYDMHGRLLKEYKEGAAERVSRTILTDDMPAGMYQLVVSGEKSSVAKMFSVVK